MCIAAESKLLRTERSKTVELTRRVEEYSQVLEETKREAREQQDGIKMDMEHHVRCLRYTPSIKALKPGIWRGFEHGD